MLVVFLSVGIIVLAGSLMAARNEIRVLREKNENQINELARVCNIVTYIQTESDFYKSEELKHRNQIEQLRDRFSNELAEKAKKLNKLSSYCTHIENQLKRIATREQYEHITSKGEQFKV